MTPPRIPPLVQFLFVFIVFFAAALLERSSPVKAASQPDAPASSALLTWAHDIAPILYNNCTTCHHPGGAGPFSLLTYSDAKRWAPQVAKVTASRYMPPWLPEPGHGDFADTRRLSDTDIAILHRWLATGMAEGKLAEAPKPPTYDATWQLGKPDLVLKAPQPYTLSAGGTDVFRNFVLPYPRTESHYIRAMEIRPGAPQVVHHANVLIDRTASYRRQHSADWQQGIPGMEILLDAGNTFDPDSHFLFWKPDTPALIEPEDMPWRLDPGNDLILNIHLKPSGKPETIDVQIGLYFTEKPPTKQPMLLQLDRDDALDIQPGDKNFVVDDSLTLPIDVEALGVYPHAHYLGKDMQVWAILPNGQKKWLVWIRDWDIDRQSVYRYREPVQLPKGTVLHMRYVYDNSESNPRNPHTPPVRVRAGNRSEDEMAHLWLQVLPLHNDPDQPDPRLQLEEAWMRSRLRKTPDDPISLYNLGAALTGEGKYKEAVEIYKKENNARPNDPRTLTALGAALDGAGDWQAARKAFEEALAAAAATHAQLCDAGFDLASIDLRRQQFNDAEKEFRNQLSACPEDAESHAGLAATLGSEGDIDAAQSELRAAINLNPNNPQTHSALAQVLSSTGNLAEAITEQKAALKLQEDDADGWSNLGVLEARTGQIESARHDFEHALKIQPDHAQAKANLTHLPAAP